MESTHRKAVIGNAQRPGGFWLFDSRSGYDLTHPSTPSAPTPSSAIKIETGTQPIAIDPAKSALVIIDMQNFFLSTDLGRPSGSAGLKVQRRLMDSVIPAARNAGIRVIWLNWGLTQADLNDMPPAALRDFGFRTEPVHEGGHEADNHRIMNDGKDSRIYKGLGADLGTVHTANDGEIPGGRILMRGEWNADLVPELKASYEAGELHNPPDLWLHKSRLSGFSVHGSQAVQALDECKIKTLFFAGINTDQCVGGSIQDAFSRGYDVILLSDGSATSSPSCAQEAIEYNCSYTWGFSVTCQQFSNGIASSSGDIRSS